jgi:4-methoxybenzoate monooxygenase (O-demethylating)
VGAPSLDIDPFDEAFLGNPYAHHEAIRAAGSLCWLPTIGAFGVARYAEVKAVLEDPVTFVSGRGVGLADFAKEEPWRPPSLLLEADPPLHDRTRGLMNKVVSLVSLRAMRGDWLAKAHALVDELVSRQRFDAVADLAEEFPLRVFPDTIGLMDEGRENLIPYGTATFNAFGPRNAIFEAGNAKAAGAIAWVAEACKRENLRPGGWGMGVYEAADRGDCSADEAERLVRSFLSAGVDTTVNGIGNMMLAFAEHPAEWAKLRENSKLATRAFEESLRFDSTVQTFFRTAASNTEINGIAIPEGSKLLLFFAAANRDPRRWNAPDVFDIERVSSGHLGFGFGIHQCLGQMMARMEAEVLLEAMIPLIQTITLTGKPVRRINNTLHALASLPVEVEENT